MRMLIGALLGALLLGVVLPAVAQCQMPEVWRIVVSQWSDMPLENFLPWFVGAFLSLKGVVAGAIIGAGAGLSTKPKQ